jgi:SAM-dependent methyltransferase
MATDPKKFWNNKIIGWENARYRAECGDFLESVASRQSSSLRFRMSKALELLEPVAKDKNILELGCGSGLLAPKLIAAGAATYTGVDIAGAAVQAGNNTLRAAGLIEERARLIEADAAGYKQANADIVFSLGLTDWLSKDQIRTMFGNFPDAAFLHSFSQKRFSVQRCIHKFYVYIAYGRKTGAYVPQYYSRREMEELCGKSARELKFISDRKLSFGAFIFHSGKDD